MDLQAHLNSLQFGLPVFAAHTALTFVVLFLLLFIHGVLAHSKTLEAVREDDVARTLENGSVVVSYSIPLAFCLAGSVDSLDILMWSIPLGITQIGISYLSEAVFHYQTQGQRESMSIAIFVTAIRLSVAIILSGAIVD